MADFFDPLTATLLVVLIGVASSIDMACSFAKAQWGAKPPIDYARIEYIQTFKPPTAKPSKIKAGKLIRWATLICAIVATYNKHGLLMNQYQMVVNGLGNIAP